MRAVIRNMNVPRIADTNSTPGDSIESTWAHTAIILSTEAVFAVLGGWMILGELLSLRGVAGCALMLGGMLVAQLGPRTGS